MTGEGGRSGPGRLFAATNMSTNCQIAKCCDELGFQLSDCLSTTKMETSVTSAVGKLDSRVGFVGGGQMALALAKGFMTSGLVAPCQVRETSDN